MAAAAPAKRRLNVSSARNDPSEASDAERSALTDAAPTVERADGANAVAAPTVERADGANAVAAPTVERARDVPPTFPGAALSTKDASVGVSVAASVSVSVAELFQGFLTVGLSGFGGVLPWARRMLVEERKWLSERDFSDTLSLCQLLPGPNIVNVAVAVGNRFQGPVGALASFSGLMLAPFAIVLVLAVVYGHYVHFQAVHGLIRGVAAAAAGLVVAVGIKMARPYRAQVRAGVFAAATFVVVALLRWPLIWTLLALGPLSIAVSYAKRTS